MLYGRDVERSRIVGLLENARGGRSGVLVLSGDPGVGKSALLEDARAQAEGMTVLSGCGIESEAHVPYAGLHQILRPALTDLDRLPAPQARALRGALGLEAGAGDEWFLVSLAVLSLLAEAAERRPLLCLVDDAHWLDEASAESLVFAARRLDAEPIAMLFAAREGENRSFDAPGLDELRLSGLDAEAAAALVASHSGGRLAPDALQRLIESTDGNPLGLLELSSTLAAGMPGGSEPLVEPLPVGVRIKQAFLSRVERLPAETQALLLVLAADDTAELEEAGHRAQRRSGFVAASLAFERAASLSETERERARLLTSAVEGAWFGGRLDRALELVGRARALTTEPTARAELDFWRGLIDLNKGVPADAAEVLLGAAEGIAAANPARALYVLSLACIASGYAGNGALVPSIAERARVLPVDGALAHFCANFVSGAGFFFAGDFARAAPRLRAALELTNEAEAASSPSHFRGLLLLAGGAALFLGDDREADRLNRRHAAAARESGSVPLLTQSLPRLFLAEIGAGHWSSAAAGLREGIRLARQAGQHQVVAHMLSVLALIAGLRGDDEECYSLATESRELAAERNLVHVALTARWAVLALELGQGRVDEAFVCGREIGQLPITLWSGSDRIEAAIRSGDRQTASAWLAVFESWAESSGEAWARAVSLRCRALLASDDAETERLLGLALDLNRDAGRPFERARTELVFGEFLRRSRRRVEAREHLRVALDGFEALGAAPWVEHARSELRASGRTARKRDPSTRGELTAQEVQIAGLVASGLSNREVAAQLFLSPRTIDFHLRNIFRKLEITSRTQLAQLDLDQAAEVERTTPAELPAAPVRA